MVNSIIKESESSKQFQSVIVPIMNALNSVVPEGAQVYDIFARIPREILGTIATSIILKTLPVENTVCDPRCTTQYGKIAVGGKSIIVPPHAGMISMGMDKHIMSPIGTAANRILAHTLASDKYGSNNTSLSDAITQYYSIVSNMISGKTGLLRDVFPVYPVTIRSVVTPYLNADPFKIMLPRKSYKTILKSNEDIQYIYDHKEPMALIKRDPVHSENSLVCVSFGLWDNNSIGISPFLLNHMDGDFDGDTCEVMLPTSMLSYCDMAKMKQNVSDLFTPRKRMLNATPETMVQSLTDTMGIGSSFLSPCEWDICLRPEIENKLIEGIDMKTLRLEVVNTIRDFTVIKEGTAQVGAISLRFIYTRNADNPEMLKSAMKLYHLLAQNTLDAKSGKQVIAMDVSNAFIFGNKTALHVNLKKLGFEDTACIQELTEMMVSMFQYKEKSSRMMQLLADKYPVTAAMQSNARPKYLKKLSQSIVNKESLGSGFWETLIEYLSGLSTSPVFDWSLRI
jgi:hypothetical protein